MRTIARILLVISNVVMLAAASATQAQDVVLGGTVVTP